MRTGRRRSGGKVETRDESEEKFQQKAFPWAAFPKTDQSRQQCETARHMNVKPCSICGHREVEAINTQLRLGTSLRKIEALFSVTRPSLSRHHKHLPPHDVAALKVEAPPPTEDEITALSLEVAQVIKSDAPVMDRARNASAVLERIAAKAEKANSLGVALQALRAFREYLEFIARLSGELEQPANTTIFNTVWFDGLVKKYESKASPTTIDVTAKEISE